MVTGLSDIGLANAAFVLNFLESEHIPCLSRSIGGGAARHLVYLPATGIARQKTKPRAAVRDAGPIVPKVAHDTEVELF